MRNAFGARTRPGGRGCLGMSLAFLAVGLAFGSLFAARAWRDVRVFTAWRPATCTILDKTISSSRGSSRSGPSYRPDVTFRYEVAGTEHRCTGWDSWALAGDYGGGSYKFYERVLDRYEVGRSYPCWYDPTDPSRAVLARRVRPLYVLAVLPLGLVALGVVGLWGTLASPSRRTGGAAGGVGARSAGGRARPGLERRLAVRLAADSKPGGASCAALVVAAVLLFVGVIAGYAGWSDYQDGEWHVLPFVFVVVFGGLGLAFLWVAAASALASRVPETVVEVERSAVAPGATVRALVRQPGPLRLRRLRVKLTCEERSPDREGSPRVAPLHDEVVAEAGATAIREGAPLELPVELRIPDGARPSRGGKAPVRWRLEVGGVPLVWPRYLLKFPIMVEPPGKAPETDAESPE